MTENELRELVVQTAKAWYGCKESDGSHRKIVDCYNSHRPLARGYALQYTDDWCAGFVSAVAIKCGLTDIIPTEVSVPYMVSSYQRLGRWEENDAYLPRKGDIIIYSWDDTGVGDRTIGASHVGIVTDVSGTAITVIEGNHGDAVGYRQISVNGRYIRGFGLPDYKSKSVIKTEEKEESEMRYQKISELPQSLQEEAQELVTLGVLSGVNDKGDLDVTLGELRSMIVSLRLYKLTKEA